MLKFGINVETKISKNIRTDDMELFRLKNVIGAAEIHDEMRMGA